MSEWNGSCRETVWEKWEVKLTVHGYSVPKMLILLERMFYNKRWAGRKKMEDNWVKTSEGMGFGIPREFFWVGTKECPSPKIKNRSLGSQGRVGHRSGKRLPHLTRSRAACGHSAL